MNKTEETARTYSRITLLILLYLYVAYLILFDDDDSFRDPVELAMFVHDFVCVAFVSLGGMNVGLLPESIVKVE